jgi:D-aminoacyl-tRNA deacylase
VIAIVVSRADSASAHIGERLRDRREWTAREDGARPDAAGGGTYHVHGDFELRTFEDLHIHLDRPADAFSTTPDLLVFVSRHSGETGPLLTAHFTGNVGPAEFGGRAGEFAESAPNAAKAVVDALGTYAPDGYEVGIECTHHGPSDVGAPSMFVELGSGEEQWADAEAADAVARAVLDLAGTPAHCDRQVVGLGGGHYAPRFTRIVRETDWAVGHVAADWGLDAMGDPRDNAAVLARAFEASGADVAVLDGEHEGLREAVESVGRRVVSETWLRETDGVDLALVGELEAALSSVDDGLRFGARAAADVDEWTVRPLPADLVDAARGVDDGATYDAAVTHLLAFETGEGATVPRGRAAVGDYEAFVDALVDVLEAGYDAVTRTDGDVVARRTSFDPAKARERGVPEGPAFGRLADGESVEVDGETVRPESVRSERVARFAVRPTADASDAG